MFPTVINIGHRAIYGFIQIGRGFLLLSEIVAQLPNAWRMRREVLDQMHIVAIGSMPLVITTAVFVGAVTAVQAVYQMQAYVPMVFLGTVISKSVFIELGPVLTALVVGGRLCANYAAELGTMKVTEQIDAMEIMAIDPIRYLALPRFIAAVLMLPVATIIANTVAILGGFLVSVMTLDVTAATFIEGMRAYFVSSDLLGGLFKSFIFGGIIALSGIHYGMSTEGGAEGVGRATMGAVVACMLSILVADYILAAVLFQILFV